MQEGGAFVGGAIYSALPLTCPNVEVIVVDDGSTDRGLDVIKPYCRCIRWETGANPGAPGERDLGLEIARGDLIRFIDADDLLLSREARSTGTPGNRKPSGIRHATEKLSRALHGVEITCRLI